MRVHDLLLLLLTVLLPITDGVVAPGNSLIADSDPPELRGRVIDAQSGVPLPGSTVMIVSLDRGVSADGEGEFRIRFLEEGEWTLEIRSAGYRTLRRQISIPLHGNLEIALEPRLIESEDVIVTASPIGRSARYQPAQAINLEVLQQKAAPSIGELLDGSAGVHTRSFGSAPARPVIRGFDGERLLVMQNGERMGDLSGTAVDHAVALDPLSLDRVEVVRGPASLLYGSNAVGGVVNLFSNDLPREWDNGSRATVATHLASMNRMGAGMIRGEHGAERFAVTGRVIYRDAGDLRTPDGRLPDTSIDNLSFGAGTAYRGDSIETGISISGMDYTYGLPEALDDPNESVEIRMNRLNLQSISTWRTGRFVDLAELRIHFSDYSHDEFELLSVPGDRPMEELEISFDQQTLSSSLLLRHRPVGALEGAFGLGFYYSDIRVGGAEALTPDASGHFIAGYLYEELALGRGWRLQGGMRLELKGMSVHSNALFPEAGQFGDRSDLILSGSAGLNYSPVQELTAGLQLARSYRAPTIEELYSDAPHLAAGSYDVGNPDLRNESGIGTDLFIDYSGTLFSAQTSLFANRIDNYIDFSPVGEIHLPSGLPVYEYRSRDALLYGFEVTAEVRPVPRFRAGGSVDYVRGLERGAEGGDLSFIPPLRIQLHLRYDNGTFWGGPRVRMVSAQRRVAANERPTDGYLLTGADGGYRFGNGVTITLRLDNLFNERYRDHLSRVENRNFPMPGRNLNMMVRWDF